MLFTHNGEELNSDLLQFCPTCRHCQRGFFCPARWYCMIGEQAREVKEDGGCEKWCERHGEILDERK